MPERTSRPLDPEQHRARNIQNGIFQDRGPLEFGVGGGGRATVRPVPRKNRAGHIGHFALSKLTPFLAQTGEIIDNSEGRLPRTQTIDDRSSKNPELRSGMVACGAPR